MAKEALAKETAGSDRCLSTGRYPFGTWKAWTDDEYEVLFPARKQIVGTQQLIPLNRPNGPKTLMQNMTPQRCQAFLPSSEAVKLATAGKKYFGQLALVCGKAWQTFFFFSCTSGAGKEFSLK